LVFENACLLGWVTVVSAPSLSEFLADGSESLQLKLRERLAAFRNSDILSLIMHSRITH
jgi:hypothetical protein